MAVPLPHCLSDLLEGEFPSGVTAVTHMVTEDPGIGHGHGGSGHGHGGSGHGHGGSGHGHGGSGHGHGGSGHGQGGHSHGPKPVYGPPKAPGHAYGPPKPVYGPPPKPRPVYGPPPKPEYGPPPKPVYGPPPKPVYGPPPAAPKPVYGPPPKPVYGPPPKPEYGPPSAPPKPVYGPPKPVYGPPKPEYGPPPKPEYGPPPKPVYGPPKPVYGPPSPPKHVYGPPKPVYGPPSLPHRPKPVYGPPKPVYGPPPSQPKPVYGPPPAPKPKPVYGPPPKPIYGSPPKPVYGPPPKPVYGPPPKPVYGPPPKPLYGPPPKPHYGPPSKDAPSRPDISYEGWMPIPGQHSSPPSSHGGGSSIGSISDVYGAPIGGGGDVGNLIPTIISGGHSGVISDSYGGPPPPPPPSASYGTPSHDVSQSFTGGSPPKRPIHFREPVPAGLITSIGAAAQGNVHDHHQGHYIPPPVPDPSLASVSGSSAVSGFPSVSYGPPSGGSGGPYPASGKPSGDFLGGGHEGRVLSGTYGPPALGGGLHISSSATLTGHGHGSGHGHGHRGGHGNGHHGGHGHKGHGSGLGFGSGGHGFGSGGHASGGGVHASGGGGHASGGGHGFGSGGGGHGHGGVSSSYGAPPPPAVSCCGPGPNLSGGPTPENSYQHRKPSPIYGGPEISGKAPEVDISPPAIVHGTYGAPAAEPLTTTSFQSNIGPVLGHQETSFSITPSITYGIPDTPQVNLAPAAHLDQPQVTYGVPQVNLNTDLTLPQALPQVTYGEPLHAAQGDQGFAQVLPQATYGIPLNQGLDLGLSQGISNFGITGGDQGLNYGFPSAIGTGGAIDGLSSAGHVSINYGLPAASPIPAPVSENTGEHIPTPSALTDGNAAGVGQPTAAAVGDAHGRVKTIPIQGEQGSYTLQIQPAGGGPDQPDIPHESVLSDGLLQNILAAIENQDNTAQAGAHSSINVNYGSNIDLNYDPTLGQQQHASASSASETLSLPGATARHSSESDEETSESKKVKVRTVNTGSADEFWRKEEKTASAQSNESSDKPVIVTPSTASLEAEENAVLQQEIQKYLDQLEAEEERYQREQQESQTHGIADATYVVPVPPESNNGLGGAGEAKDSDVEGATDSGEGGGAFEGGSVVSTSQSVSSSVSSSVGSGPSSDENVEIVTGSPIDPNFGSYVSFTAPHVKYHYGKTGGSNFETNSHKKK
ncbi:uncharacterized protein [Hetaerina americana]|uniref:uncharacterized protein n=1 Tax=Hetaerina americana TaxID=62018 RepID=UPI003A7F3CBF